LLYHTVLTAKRKRGDGEGAEQLLRQIIDLYESGAWEAGPTRMTYELVVNAWAHSPQPDAALRADAVVHLMQERHVQNPEDCPPVDYFMYLALLESWSTSPLEKAPDKAEALLRMMREDEIRNNKKAPDTAKYVIPPTAIKAEQKLKTTGQIYSLVAKAWSQSQSPHAATRAQRLLDELIQRREEGESHLGFPYLLYHAVFNAWVKSGRKDSADRAYHIVKAMEELNRNIKGFDPPTRTHYLTVIDLYVVHGEALTAHTLLQQFVKEEKVEPHATIFNDIMKAYACASQRPDAPERAEALLRSMKEYDRKGYHCVPSNAIYSNLLRIWMVSQRPEAVTRAEALLREQIEMAMTKQLSESFMPSIYSFIMLLRIVRQSTHLSAARKRKYFDDIKALAKACKCNISSAGFEIELAKCRKSTTIDDT
jgi:hypothetical protein